MNNRWRKKKRKKERKKERIMIENRGEIEKEVIKKE